MVKSEFQVRCESGYALTFSFFLGLNGYVGPVLPMFLITPPCEGVLNAHLKKRADAALRIWFKLARPVGPSPMFMGWKKHSALSGTCSVIRGVVESKSSLPLFF